MDTFDVSLQNSQLRATLRGELTTEGASALREQICEEVSDATDKLVVVFDFRELTECGVFARSELIKLQRVLMEQVQRTAYVADVARFRGLAMWVVNIAEDQNAKVCTTDAMAQSWLKSSVERRVEIRERTTAAIAARKGAK